MTNNPQIAKPQIESERDQSFTTSKYTFWDIDFRQVIKKQKTQKVPLTLLHTCLKEFR